MIRTTTASAPTASDLVVAIGFPSARAGRIRLVRDRGPRWPARDLPVGDLAQPRDQLDPPAGRDPRTERIRGMGTAHRPPGALERREGDADAVAMCRLRERVVGPRVA